MPIRTNRGRAAVYRRLWGWPVRSPWHLIGSVIVLAVIITALGFGLPKLLGAGGDGTAASARPAPGSEEGAAAPAQRGDTGSGPTRLTAPLESPKEAEPDATALRVATQWAQAWTNHPAGITNEQWLDGLRPMTTEEYLPVMGSVDPANIPATKVTGEPKPTTSYTSSVEVTVPTDGPALSITVVNTNAGWRVAHYEQAG